MIEYLTLKDAAGLDEYVIHHPHGHFMQTTLYGIARPDYSWNAIILRNDAGKITASIALHSRPVKFTGKRLYYAPRGPVFDTIEDYRTIIKVAKDYCKSHKGYLLRIDPPILEGDLEFRKESEAMGFQFDPRSDYSTFNARCVYQTRLEGLTADELMARFHQKTRYNIRLSQRRGVTVRQAGIDELPVFCKMMHETGGRDGFHARPQSFFENFLLAMGDNARFLVAEKDGKVLAGVIELILGKNAWYVWGCSYNEGREDMPNYLLQWEMMRYALEKGCSIYDFRGVMGMPVPENPHYGLHRFKQGYAADFVAFAGQMDLVLDPFAFRLIQLLQKIRK